MGRFQVENKKETKEEVHVLAGAQSGPWGGFLQGFFFLFHRNTCVLYLRRHSCVLLEEEEEEKDVDC